MCGIIGIFGNDGNLKEDLENSLKVIEHRGSNILEYKIFDSCALGANRLPITDEKGMQPMSNEDNTVFAIQNGEIFNYKELTQELTKKGHSIKSKCDTEILTHLWEEYGTEMVYKIDSEMFAFAIYDKRTDEFFIARDALGVKPLYYASDSKGRFFVASEIKQLSQFESIKEIREFPAGHFYYKGNFQKYFKYPHKTTNDNKKEIISNLKSLIEKAVKKRVQTDLPIGVFLSGGVDSSLIMDIASKYHSNITAIILGTTDSPDFVNAVRLAKEKGWKYVTIEPKVDYEKKTGEIIYSLESYEPNIVRHAFANDLVSKKAKELGLKIVLTGEGADELFGGYNEFCQLPSGQVNFGCIKLLESMSKGHLMRIDKMAMKYTVETRSPFFDKELFNYALSIPGKLKVLINGNNCITKSILREIASSYLPEYIAYRYKAPFANGAGMDVGTNFSNSDGTIGKIAEKIISDKEFIKMKKIYSKYNITTKEEAFYIRFYEKFGYLKFKDGERRIIVKDNLANEINKNISFVCDNIIKILKRNEWIDKSQTNRFNDFDYLKNYFLNVINEGKIIQIVTYWGVEKGQIADKDDIISLEVINSIQEEIRQIYPLVETLLVLTDIHGKINGLSQEKIKRYYSSVESTAKKLSLKTIFLSSLWAKHKLDINNLNNHKKSKEHRIEQFLLDASTKHYHGKNKLKGAINYLICSKFDKKIMQKEFSNSLFFTYNSAKWKETLPNLLTISLYGTKKGYHIKPWHFTT
ncbi:MAG: asparagine synthase-related protein [Nanoarchaeota archaeon]